VSWPPPRQNGRIRAERRTPMLRNGAIERGGLHRHGKEKSLRTLPRDG
jgi:hypothetical protein